MLDPSDNDVLNNLKFAKNATIDQIDILPESIFSKGWRATIMLLSQDEWAYLSIITAMLFVGLFISYYRSTFVTYKRLLFISAWFVALVSLSTVIFAFQQQSYMDNNLGAIVFAGSTAVKSEPNTQGEAVFTLHEGTKVKVVEHLDNWSKIKLADGKIGWVLGSDIKLL